MLPRKTFAMVLEEPRRLAPRELFLEH